MSKIKVIDLLNKIANGEKPPQKIKHLKQIYKLYENYEDTGLIKYENNEDFYVLDLINSLNDTVEIIEEEPEIDIQSLEELRTEYTESRTDYDMRNYINRVILPAIKQLDKRTNNK